MLHKKFIAFGKPSIGNQELNYSNKVMKGGWIGTGPVTQKFEKNFSTYKKAKFALSVNSCTAALHLSLISLGLKVGDEVITTPLTFCSTINSIIISGCKPILTDIRKDSLNIDENFIEKKITKKTKAILLVHFAGLPCNMSRIMKIANKYKLKVIEDCAHAIETEYYGKKAGTFGDVGCFSFYANKNITTGEGGMIICKSKIFAEKIKILRLHGMSKDAWKRYLPDAVPITKKNTHYDVKYTGYKYNMTDLQASMGVCQLKKIDAMWKKRNKLYKKYLKELRGLPIFVQNASDYKFKHALHLFVIIIDKTKTNKSRDSLINFLFKKKIGSAVHYRSVTEMTNYKKLFNWNNNSFPNSFYVGQNTVSLPLYPDLTNKEQNYIISQVKKFFDV
jgi:dTDP-4-amino-4,6-dideoxygalactose transaminase